MTKVISRLYNSYDRASQAVRDLEAAGVPHSDISLVANNADNWYSGNGTRNASIATLMASMTGQKVRAKAPASARLSAAPRVCSRVSAFSPFQASVRWSQRAGSSPPPPVRLLVE